MVVLRVEVVGPMLREEPTWVLDVDERRGGGGGATAVHGGDNQRDNRGVCGNSGGCDNHSYNRCSGEEDGRRNHGKIHGPSWLQADLQNREHLTSVAFLPEKPRNKLGEHWAEGSSKGFDP